jgi:hypothetical protein
VSGVGVIRPPGVGIYRPVEAVLKGNKDAWKGPVKDAVLRAKLPEAE